MMKKLLPALVIISFLVVLIAPAAALAATPDLGKCSIKKDVGLGTDCPQTGFPVDCLYDGTTYKCGICCLLNTIYNITDWVFVVLIAAVSIMVILGAFSFLTSAGSPEGTKKGRDYILYAAIGLAVAFLARAVPALVKMIVGA